MEPRSPKQKPEHRTRKEHTKSPQHPKQNQAEETREDEITYADDANIIAEQDTTSQIITRLENCDRVAKSRQHGRQWGKRKSPQGEKKEQKYKNPYMGNSPESKYTQQEQYSGK